MQILQGHGLQRLRSCCRCSIIVSTRNASLTSAISRGIRKGASTVDRIGTTRRSPKVESPGNHPSQAPRSRLELERSTQHDREQPWKKKPWMKEREARSNISHEAPAGMPYTTAGSEFLYGTFAVKAALEAKRRRLYQLYIWKGERSSEDQLDDSIYQLARSKRVRVQDVAGSWDKTLMKMSGQRPHNGYVLEASRIPRLPITTLTAMENPRDAIGATIAPQSAEDQTVNSVFDVDGSTSSVPRNARSQRFPLLLWLDRITDTGNLGAIIRTAYFLGVDAIIIPEHGTAPFSPVTVKASAGAAEWLPILTVKKEIDFVRASQENGWKFFAAVAPDSSSTRTRTNRKQVDASAGALDSNPCILMVGNEGEGLRGFLQKAADKSLSIHGTHKTSNAVDSLNVSVAAALLMSRFFADSGKLTKSSPPPVKETAVEEAIPEQSGSVF